MKERRQIPEATELLGVGSVTHMTCDLVCPCHVMSVLGAPSCEHLQSCQGQRCPAKTLGEGRCSPEFAVVFLPCPASLFTVSLILNYMPSVTPLSLQITQSLQIQVRSPGLALPAVCPDHVCAGGAETCTDGSVRVCASLCPLGVHTVCTTL